MSIYTITTLKSVLNNNIENFESSESRTIGYYNDFSSAEKVVLNNSFDIHEYYYDYVVIEEIQEGVYRSFCKNSSWYKWLNGKYEKIEPIMVNYCIASIG